MTPPTTSDIPSPSGNTSNDAVCPICAGCARYEFSGRDLMYDLHQRYDYYLCTGCGGTFQHPMPDMKTIASFYPSDYSVYAADATQRRISPLRKALLRQTCGYAGLDVALLWRVLASLLAPFVAPPATPRFIESGRMLDVGCGNGRYLSTMRKLGWQVQGVEFSADGVRACHQVNLPVHHGDLHSALFPDASFDLVTVRHVIEHIAEPQPFFAELARILKPGGQLIFETPNSDALGRALFGANWYHNDVPRHLILYSPSNLTDLAKRHGFGAMAPVMESSPKALLNSIDYIARKKDAPSRKIRWRRLAARMYVVWSMSCKRGDTFRLCLIKS